MMDYFGVLSGFVATMCCFGDYLLDYEGGIEG